jgi:hypothetical protein
LFPRFSFSLFFFLTLSIAFLANLKKGFFETGDYGAQRGWAAAHVQYLEIAMPVGPVLGDSAPPSGASVNSMLGILSSGNAGGTQSANVKMFDKGGGYRLLLRQATDRISLRIVANTISDLTVCLFSNSGFVASGVITPSSWESAFTITSGGDGCFDEILITDPCPTQTWGIDDLKVYSAASCDRNAGTR